MHRLDLGGQRGVFPLPARRPAITCCVEGGTGDLQQLARPLDIAPLRLLRLDERVAVHRVSFAKKAVVRFRISASSRSLRFSLRSSANSRCSSLARPRPAASRRPTPPASPIRAPRSRSGQSPSRPGRPTGPALAQLNDLRLELRRERTALPGLVPHALHDRTFFRGKTPDAGCPSKRVRPTCSPTPHGATRIGTPPGAREPARFSAPRRGQQ